MGSRARVIVLALSAGAVDAIGFLTLFGVFTAHLSGDTTKLAIDLGRGNVGTDAFARVAVIVAFIVGVIVGVAVVSASARRTRGLLVTELACLVALMVAGSLGRNDGHLHFGGAMFFVLIALAALAMGLQSGLLRRTAGTSVHTTFVTGMLTVMGEDAVAWFRDRADHEARRRLGLHSNIWIGYLVGGIVGAALGLEWHFWALGLPIALLVAVLVDETRS